MDNIDVFFNSRKKYGIKPGLDRVNKLLKAVGHPEKAIKAIHVTGTNGKGSTIAYIQRTLIDQQYDVGVFTSPSMTSIEGHIFINDKQISKQQFHLLLKKLMPHIERLDAEQNYPSEFEIITVMAFLYFKEKRVDIALIETGMGARLDTTNCIVPLISIITSIDVDHTQFLGETIEQITYEKIGVIKRNVPVIVGNVSELSKRLINDEAEKVNAPVFYLNEHFTYESLDKNVFYFQTGNKKQKVMLKMEGIHQFENASVAIKSLLLLNELEIEINRAKLFKSMSETIVPGRIELIWKEPMIIIDGAHNKASLEALIQTVKTHYNDKKIHLIFAAFKDKALDDLSSMIESEFSSITLTTFEHERAITADVLSTFFTKIDVTVCHNWKEMIHSVIQNKNNTLYLITGSLHFIFLVRHYLSNLLDDSVL